MTKSTITREPITHYLKIYPEFFSAVCTGVKRAELRKNDRDYRVGDTLHLMETPRGSCHQTGEFINVKITHIADVGEWMPGHVLLSIEREALDSEPVAWMSKGGTVLNGMRQSAHDFAHYNIPLYRHAQPAPVVPEEMKIPTIDEWENKSVFMEMFGRATGWNAFRAAMLQAGSSPAQNQGWIPVSERMPENDESKPIAIFTGKCLGQGIFVATYDDNGFFDFWEGMEIFGVTHWMPLPAAPQEVKGE